MQINITANRIWLSPLDSIVRQYFVYTSNQESLDMYVAKISHVQGLTFSIGKIKRFIKNIRLSMCFGPEF